MLKPARLTRKVVDLTADVVPDLPDPCRSCTFWERGPLARRPADVNGSAIATKQAWLSSTRTDWGSCGKVAYVDGALVGFALYAPPTLLPRAASFPTSPISEDAVLLATLRVLPPHEGLGLGKSLVHAIAKDLLSRSDVHAIEAFGDARWKRPECVLPAAYLEAIGFHVVRPHSRYPRLRFDLRSAIPWRADLGVALQRLRGVVRPERAPSPAQRVRASAPDPSR